MPIVALSLPVSATASRAAGGFTVPGRAHLLYHLFGPQARQRPCSRFTRQFQSLRSVAVSVVAAKLLGVQE